jgi:hypothetical protein
MGYNIYIGNAELKSSWPDPADEYSDPPVAEWVVEGMIHADAPYSSDSGHSNSRDPSYTGWAEFCREVGIEEWMLKRYEGKMGYHPGCSALTKEDASFLTTLLNDYKEKHPTEEACWCECSSCQYGKKTDIKHNPNASGTLVRLTWLTWWVNWAVENCERPAIYNS